MIEREGREFVVQCDTCSEVLFTDEDEFMAAWDTAKRAGWRTHKIDAEWVHMCPACAEG